MKKRLQALKSRALFLMGITILIVIIFGAVVMHYIENKRGYGGGGAIACTAMDYQEKDDVGHLQILWNEKAYWLQVDDKLKKKIADTDLEDIIGVEYTYFIPDHVLEEKHLNESDIYPEYLLSHEGFEAYFEICDFDVNVNQ